MMKNILLNFVLFLLILVIPTTFAANEIKVIPAKDANFEAPTTQSIEYTVNHESEENIVNLGEILQAELAKAGTMLRFITDPLPTGFIFDNIKNILNISKDEATAGVTQKIEYEICQDKPVGLNDLEFKIEPKPTIPNQPDPDFPDDQHDSGVTED